MIMELFIVDAFTSERFGGNQAGVILLPEEKEYPADSVMQNIAAELRYSETAFVQSGKGGIFKLRYFTPEGEVALCGHATISVFTVLREENRISCGTYRVDTAAGKLNVTVEPDRIWLQMPRGELLRQLTDEEASRVYAAYGLTLKNQPNGLRPSAVKVGLADIMVPVDSKAALDNVVQNRAAVIELSKELQVGGAHLFYCTQEGQPTAFCRNFAPLYGIDEESATGTSNAALTYFLHQNGRIKSGAVNMFVQGETMGRPSQIMSRIDDDSMIQIGGGAVITVKGNLNI